MSRKIIRIATLGVPSDYRASLLPLIIRRMGYQIAWTNATWANLIIYGPFYNPYSPRLRWLPRTWRKHAALLLDAIQKEMANRSSPPLTLFHTAENLRHDHMQTDFAISYDLNVPSERHFRLPYWMEMIDWSHEGVAGNNNPRYGGLLKLERLRSPLGKQFLSRQKKAVLMTSHLREPRASCLAALQRWMPVEGMGPYFDPKIKDHHHSSFLKKEILKCYGYNLCPENGIYPGYVTEKIPEAFASGCLPITYVDPSVNVDFNPRAFINLEPMEKSDDQNLGKILTSQTRLQGYADEPLLLKTPSIFPLQQWVQEMIRAAL